MLGRSTDGWDLIFNNPYFESRPLKYCPQRISFRHRKDMSMESKSRLRYPMIPCPFYWADNCTLHKLWTMKLISVLNKGEFVITESESLLFTFNLMYLLYLAVKCRNTRPFLVDYHFLPFEECPFEFLTADWTLCK